MGLTNNDEINACKMLFGDNVTAVIQGIAEFENRPISTVLMGIVIDSIKYSAAVGVDFEVGNIDD